MKCYNLLDEKWIPVRYPDGTRDYLGIRATLHGAASIMAIEDSSPLVVAAVHRLLLAILYRALQGPSDIDEAKALFRNGLPIDGISIYLDAWKDRFWLGHDKYPFFQIAEYEPKLERGAPQWRAWTAIAAEHNGDNSKILFDHTNNLDPGPLPADQAARWLVACQTFALGGGNSDFQYTTNAPSAAAAMTLPLGRNLEDTLIFSLVPENREILSADLPLWERPPDGLSTLKDGAKRSAAGWVDLYTWRSRSIRLRLEDSGQIVTGLLFASGIGWQSAVATESDPMLAYRVDKDKGRLPVQFTNRGIWRAFDSLLPDAAGNAPRVVEHAASLSRLVPERAPRSVMVLGQANFIQQAKIEFWRLERFTLPGRLTGPGLVREEIRQLLDAAEGAQRKLWSACRTFGSHMLSRGGRDPAKGDVTAFVDQIFAVQAYWSLLETEFHALLDMMSGEYNSDIARRQWLRAIRDALVQSWDRVSASASGGDAWAIRALVKAEVAISGEVKRLSTEIRSLGNGGDNP